MSKVASVKDAKIRREEETKEETKISKEPEKSNTLSQETILKWKR